MPKVPAGRVKKPSASKSYAMPEKIPKGMVLTDLTKVQWRIGPSVGKGGFGEIYSASQVGAEENYNFIVKCEPHVNGPLFVEMHFYMRNAKLDDIKRYIQKRRLKSIGVPHMVGSGSMTINNIKHRFIVLPRYGTDIKTLITANGDRLPESTAYRIALQMLDVYEYVHSCGYVHADLKSGNIVLGSGNEALSQTYLIDFGLASHFNTAEFIPDPKKMHNGTIEYTSRDAHLGVPTRRGDFEILGYNLIEWLGYQLPWVQEKLLTLPVKVQKSKEQFFVNLDSNLSKIFSNTVPGPVTEYLKYVKKMEYNQEPDYNICRQMFLTALKKMGVKLTGDLEFKNVEKTKKVKTKHTPNKKKIQEDTEEDESDDGNNEKVESPVTKRIKTQKATLKVPKSRRLATKVNPQLTPKKRGSRSVSKSPQNKKTQSDKISNKTVETNSPYKTRSSPSSSKADKQRSSALSVHSPSNGKIKIDNSNTNTPKTFHINFELDISMDANVIVNVKRKRKSPGGVSDGAPSKRSPQLSDAKVINKNQNKATFNLTTSKKRNAKS